MKQTILKSLSCLKLQPRILIIRYFLTVITRTTVLIPFWSFFFFFSLQMKFNLENSYCLSWGYFKCGGNLVWEGMAHKVGHRDTIALFSTNIVPKLDFKSTFVVSSKYPLAFLQCLQRGKERFSFWTCCWDVYLINACCCLYCATIFGVIWSVTLVRGTDYSCNPSYFKLTRYFIRLPRSLRRIKLRGA